MNHLVFKAIGRAFVLKYPETEEDIIDLMELALDEIESGESEIGELAKFQQSLSDIEKRIGDKI